jgi:hypothetical protein
MLGLDLREAQADFDCDPILLRHVATFRLGSI